MFPLDKHFLLPRWFQIELAKDIGYSAARYGHVMFPENVYEPALQCAELLLDGVGKGLILLLSFLSCQTNWLLKAWMFKNDIIHTFHLSFILQDGHLELTFLTMDLQQLKLLWRWLFANTCLTIASMQIFTRLVHKKDV